VSAMRRAGARPQVAALVLACLLAALLAGCGGGKGATTSTTTTAAAVPLGKAAYVREMTRIGHGLSSDINAVGSPTSAKKAAASLTKAQAEVRAAERKLAAIVPPPAVKAAHLRLTRAVGNFARELDPVIAALAAGHLTALATLTSLPAFRQIATAAGQIVKAGYKINT
jgi:hypothetical protein